MSDLLATGNSWLAGILKNKVSRTVTYTRGAYSVSLSATEGNSARDLLDTEGFGERIDTIDFIITRTDLVLNSVTVLPQRGDTITETYGGKTRTYTVIPPSEGEECYREVARKYQLRIHTKQTAAT